MTRTRNKGEAELYCNEDGIDKEQEKATPIRYNAPIRGVKYGRMFGFRKKYPVTS